MTGNDDGAALADVIQIRPVEAGIAIWDVLDDLKLFDVLFEDRGLSDGPVEPQPSAGATVSQLLSPLVEHLPHAAEALRSTGDVRIVFSPEVRKGLADGSLRLMKTGRGVAPTAVSGTTGRIVEHGVIAGGAVGVAGAAAALWPVVLAGAVAAAAGQAERRWLERTFAELDARLARIETRLRDDDHGALAAADATVELLRPSLGAPIPSQMALELAVARFETERIFHSRRRFVTRFIEELNEAQRRHVEQKGEPKGWVGVAQDLADDALGVLDEIVVYLRAMIVRARVTVATSVVVTSDGDPATAIRLLDTMHGSMREDYYELYRRLRALGAHGPDEGFWRRVPGVERLLGDDLQRAHRRVGDLAATMDELIGSSLPESQEQLLLVARAA